MYGSNPESEFQVAQLASPGPVQNQSLEAMLLFLCARVSIDSTTGAIIQSLTEQKIDWQFFSRLVERHGLVPLVSSHFRDLFDGALPDEISQQWHSTSRCI